MSAQEHADAHLRGRYPKSLLSIEEKRLVREMLKLGKRPKPRRDAPERSDSVRTVSGGLPGLGKKRK
jgi:hypothetical protein